MLADGSVTVTESNRSEAAERLNRGAGLRKLRGQ